MTEPLPCPFCGSDRVQSLCVGECHYVRCYGCDAMGSEHLSADEAVAKWNRASQIVNDTKALCEAHGVPWDA